jgi:predicted esterase
MTANQATGSLSRSGVPRRGSGSHGLLMRRAVALTSMVVVAAVALVGCGATKERSTSPSPAPRTVKVIRDVKYGSNTTYSGARMTLTLDVYDPATGPHKERPLLILLPGGGFRSNGTDKSQLAGLATEVAKRGIVVACIDYRTFSGSTVMSAATVRTVILQGMQDAKAAVRFFRKDAATSDAYGIDPTRIVLGGHSAGAVDSGQAVYLDQLSKANAELRAIIQANGGLEGQSGNPGYDSSVSGWIGLAGGLEERAWVTASSPPMLGVYGTNDTLVPPKESSALGSGLPFSGVLSLYRRAISVGLTGSRIYAIQFGDHVAPVDASNRKLVSRIVRFVESQPSLVGLSPRGTLAPIVEPEAAPASPTWHYRVFSTLDHFPRPAGVGEHAVTNEDQVGHSVVQCSLREFRSSNAPTADYGDP